MPTRMWFIAVYVVFTRGMHVFRRTRCTCLADELFDSLCQLPNSYVGLSSILRAQLLMGYLRRLNWRKPSGMDVKASEIDGVELSSAHWAWSAASRLTEPELNDTQ